MKGYVERGYRRLLIDYANPSLHLHSTSLLCQTEVNCLIAHTKGSFYITLKRMCTRATITFYSLSINRICQPYL